MKQTVWSLVSHFGVSAVPYVKGATGERLPFILFISISAKEAFIRANHWYAGIVTFIATPKD